jgi:hypothetical protein
VSVNVGGGPGGIQGGTGIVTIVNGTLNSNLTVDYGPGAAATVWLESGAIIATNSSSGANIYVVNNGNLVASNGTIVTPYMSIAGKTQLLGGIATVSSNLTVSTAVTSFTNLLVAGGDLYVTNATSTAQMTDNTGFGFGYAMIMLTNGTITADSLTLMPSSRFILGGGTLTTKNTTITSPLGLVVGDGTNATVFRLNGGVHSFSNGLVIANNATLTGCGTINGNVLVDPGATVLLNCGGTMTFTGILSNNGTVQAIDASVIESYGTVVNNGTIDSINGSTNFHGAFINNGTLLTGSGVVVAQANVSGQDFVVQVPSVTGHTYQMQYSVSLPAINWVNTGSTQSGTGGVLSFTDPGGATNTPSRFYQIQVTAP